MRLLDLTRQTGFPQEELKSSNPEDLLTFGETWLPLSAKEEEKPVDMFPARRSSLRAPITYRDLP